MNINQIFVWFFSGKIKNCFLVEYANFDRAFYLFKQG